MKNVIMGVSILAVVCLNRDGKWEGLVFEDCDMYNDASWDLVIASPRDTANEMISLLADWFDISEEQIMVA